MRGDCVCGHARVLHNRGGDCKAVVNPAGADSSRPRSKPTNRSNYHPATGCTSSQKAGPMKTVTRSTLLVPPTTCVSHERGMLFVMVD